MSVKRAEQELLAAAIEFANHAGDARKPVLLQAAIEYGKAKASALKRRDLWKLRKRLGKNHGQG